jgi:EAL domain-containing protein (putative c-di-GMP-specific phosphodiesterase class I)
MTSNQHINGIADQPDPDVSSALTRVDTLARFQPKVDLRSARVVGVEALADEVTERVMEDSIRAAGDWWRSGLGLQLSVNLPEGALSEADRDLLGFIKRTLSTCGLPGKALQFAVTEGALIAQPDLAADVLSRLSELGSTISIDDFGTGHFSLRQVMRLPIDEIKIDRSFVAGISTNDEDLRIVRSIIHLAHQMGLQVAAKGVETEEAWRQLRSMGCERAQGSLIAESLQAREVPAWLATWNTRARELSSTRRPRRSTPKPAQKRSPSQAKAPA